MQKNNSKPSLPPQWLDMQANSPQTLGELLPDLIAKYQLHDFRNSEQPRPRRERMEAGAA